jgi:tetratricopeptide (TPR) repeat protein
LNAYQKGVKDLSNALSSNDKNPIIYYRRGLAYYKNRDYLAAIKDLEESLQHKPSKGIQADIYYHMGIAHSNLEHFD